MTIYDAKGVPVRSGAMSRRKGQQWQLACRTALKAIGRQCRQPQPGEAGDDIVLLGDTRWSIEAKDQSRDALPAWVAQAERQAGDERIGIVWHKRRGKADAMDGYITMRARDFWKKVA